MAKKGKVEITGGMSPTFISTIARSKFVNDKVEDTYAGVKKKLEAKASARAPLQSNRLGKYQYGSKRKRGKWGDTWLLWAITRPAQKNTQWIRAAISAAKNVHPKN